MSALHLVQAPISVSAFHRWAAERGFGWTKRNEKGTCHRQVAFDEGRALHHLLGEMFGKGALQPFRLFVAPGGRASLYAYSTRDINLLRETARNVAMPEVLRICNPDRFAAKPMPAGWRENRCLGFDLRVRPVRRLAKECGIFTKGAEVDAFLVEALRRFPDSPEAEENMGKAGLTREVVYTEWLTERFGVAAAVKNARLIRFQRVRAARGGRALEGPDATFHGELEVRDPAAFAACLAKGVGRHTAYGYGMLLLRPAGKA